MRKVSIILFITGIIVFLSGLIPTIISNNEILKIDNSIKIVSKSLKIKKIDNIQVKNKVFFNKKLNSDVTKYLNNIINISNKILVINDDEVLNNILSSKNITDDLNLKIDYLNTKKEEIDNLYKKVNDINSVELNINNKNIKKELSNIDLKEYENILNTNLKIVNGFIESINYLNNNSNYKIENNNLVFMNSNGVNEFKSLIASFNNRKLSIVPILLYNDVDVPIINASDITIYEGNGVDIKSKVSCIDEVDGNLECSIVGNYNKNELGIYPITISATDKSGNNTSKIINVNVIERERLRYYTEIIRNQNVVIVYELDENREYTNIVKVFPCSTGRNNRTPTGIFYSRKGGVWGPLMGGVWGQYYTVITGNILFHSVPYYSMSKDNLEWEEYNKLGNQASAGCVRLSVIDAKWIYDNCPNGMKIKIYDGELPEGVTKPSSIIIDENNPNRGWDPTDPDPNNPWNLN